MTTTTFANRVTAGYLAKRAAAAAGGSPINFIAGTLVVGDGNGTMPSLSALISANGVLHEVWRGNVIVAVGVNSDNSAQIDIRCVIPAAISGVEIGPFDIREFALLDAAGDCMVVGQTNVHKSTSAEGQVSDLTLIVSIGESSSEVVLLAPGSSDFVTDAELLAAINAHLPDAQAPLTKTDTTLSGGWIRRVFGLRAARQPAPEASPAVLEVDSSGYGRPATNSEFTAGASAGGFAWPWPTLQQIKAAFDAINIAISSIQIPGAIAPIFYDSGAKKYGVGIASNSARGVGRVATSDEVIARATNTLSGSNPGPAFLRPEDIPNFGGYVDVAGDWIFPTYGMYEILFQYNGGSQKFQATRNDGTAWKDIALWGGSPAMPGGIVNGRLTVAVYPENFAILVSTWPIQGALPPTDGSSAIDMAAAYINGGVPNGAMGENNSAPSGEGHDRMRLVASMGAAPTFRWNKMRKLI